MGRLLLIVFVDKGNEEEGILAKAMRRLCYRRKRLHIAEGLIGSIKL